MLSLSYDTLLLVSDLLAVTKYSTMLAILVLGTPFIVSYAITWVLAIGISGLTAKGQPPEAPYWVPILGHALTFFWDTSSMAKLTRYGCSCLVLYTSYRQESR